MKDDFDLTPLAEKKPKRKNSKAKGSTFERKVCRLLNEKFGTKEFSRTPGSGAYATTHNLPAHLKIYGDVITPLNFQFDIEAKKGYSKENICSFFNPKSDLRRMIDQANRDSKKSGHYFLLIIEQDRRDAIAITNYKFNLNDFKFHMEIVGSTGDRLYASSLKELLRVDNNEFFE